MTAETEEFRAVKVKTAALMVDTSTDILYAAIRAGDLRAFKIGSKDIRIDTADLRAWLHNLAKA